MTRDERKRKSEAMKTHLNNQLQHFMNKVVTPALIDFSQDNMLHNREIMKLSPIEIREQHGDNCETIFRILFTLYQVGGLSADKFPYKTLWVAHAANQRVYGIFIRDCEFASGKELLAALRDKGCQESRRIKLGEQPEIISGEKLAEYKTLMKKLRLYEREVREHATATYW